jgi:hypothetical protein
MLRIYFNTKRDFVRRDGQRGGMAGHSGKVQCEWLTHHVPGAVPVAATDGYCILFDGTDVHAFLVSTLTPRVRAHLRSDALNAFDVHPDPFSPTESYCYVYFVDMLSPLEWDQRRAVRHAVRHRALTTLTRRYNLPDELFLEIVRRLH